MSVTIEKNQGVRLALAASGATPLNKLREPGGYYKARSYHGGGEFFEAENAQVILQCLGEFLPRALERTAGDGRQEIFYQHLINGQDVCSSTAPLDSGVNVPPRELARLEAAVAQLKAKETDPSTDPTKREIIRAFRLPNPEKDPELYRLYGRGANRRLLVLWGVERQAGSSLPPQEALRQMPSSKRRSAWWYSLLLLPLLILLAWWWWQVQRPADSKAEPLPEASKPLPMSVPSAEAGTTDSSNAGSAGSGALPSSADSSVPPSPGLAETSAETANAAANGSESQKSANPEKNPDTSNPPPPVSNEPSGPSSPQAEATNNPPLPVSTVEPEVDPKLEGPATDENTANIPDEVPTSDEKTISEPSEPVAPSESVESPGVPGAPETPPATSPSTQPAAEQPARAADPPTKTSAPPQPAGTPSSAPSPKSNATPTPQTQPLSAEIVNARTSAVPKDGKVEMQMSMLARDADGNAVAISKMESWSINGKTQNDETGRPIIANGLPVNLTEGVHRVRATGSTADGRLVSAVAEVNVDFVVRQEASVQVKQVEKPKP